MNWRKHGISLCSSHPINTKISINLSMCLNSCTCKNITTNHTTSRTSTHHSNHTRREGVVETSDEEVGEEDLVEEEAKLCAITMDKWVTMLEIT